MFLKNKLSFQQIIQFSKQILNAYIVRFVLDSMSSSFCSIYHFFLTSFPFVPPFYFYITFSLLGSWLKLITLTFVNALYTSCPHYGVGVSQTSTFLHIKYSVYITSQVLYLFFSPRWVIEVGSGCSWSLGPQLGHTDDEYMSPKAQNFFCCSGENHSSECQQAKGALQASGSCFSDVATERNNFHTKLCSLFQFFHQSEWKLYPGLII